MTAFCVEHLHRLPQEIDVPLSAIVQTMRAMGFVRERRENEG